MIQEIFSRILERVRSKTSREKLVSVGDIIQGTLFVTEYLGKDKPSKVAKWRDGVVEAIGRGSITAEELLKEAEEDLTIYPKLKDFLGVSLININSVFYVCEAVYPETVDPKTKFPLFLHSFGTSGAIPTAVLALRGEDFELYSVVSLRRSGFKPIGLSTFVERNLIKVKKVGENRYSIELPVNFNVPRGVDYESYLKLLILQYIHFSSPRKILKPVELLEQVRRLKNIEMEERRKGLISKAAVRESEILWNLGKIIEIL